jgi:hypothetical protein
MDMTELLQQAFELVSHLSNEEQDAIAARLIEQVHPAADPSAETLETFLGAGLHRSPPSEEEMAELRALAETEPAIAAVLRMAARGGLDVETILATRNAE